MEALEAARAKQLAEEQAFAAAKQEAIEAAAAGKSLPTTSTASAPHRLESRQPRPRLRAARSSRSPASSAAVHLRRRVAVRVRLLRSVLYVYAQFGISLPHSSLRQGANGVRVAQPEPGDLVVVDGGNHIGIYTGNGHMIDAPMPGRVVNERPIYTSNHFFVRY